MTVSSTDSHVNKTAIGIVSSVKNTFRITEYFQKFLNCCVLFFIVTFVGNFRCLSRFSDCKFECANSIQNLSWNREWRWRRNFAPTLNHEMEAETSHKLWDCRIINICRLQSDMQRPFFCVPSSFLRTIINQLLLDMYHLRLKYFGWQNLNLQYEDQNCFSSLLLDSFSVQIMR